MCAGMFSLVLVILYCNAEDEEAKLDHDEIEKVTSSCIWKMSLENCKLLK